MVALHCASLAERALVPAFVFFFQLLYPFARVNDPLRATAAAAGGTILVRRRALDRIGGIEAVRGALIDDVALARAVKRGGRIWLGHTGLARSLRPYPRPVDVWRMVARTAYVQLRFSPFVLAGTVLGLALVWLAPPAATLFGHGAAPALGLLAWGMASASYLPTLRRFGLWPAWAPFLPLVALFYMAATVGSAIDHHRGRGVDLARARLSGSRGLSASAAGVEAWSGKDRGDENFPVGSVLIRNGTAPACARLLRLRPQRRRHRRQRDAGAGGEDRAARPHGGGAARPGGDGIAERAAAAGEPRRDRHHRRATRPTCSSPSARTRPSAAMRAGTSSRSTAASPPTRSDE